MKNILLALSLVLLSNVAVAADELYLKNVVSGYITIIDEPCTVDDFKEVFPFKAVVDNGKTGEDYKSMEGCWTAPTTTPPKEGMRAIVTIKIKDELDNSIQREYYLDSFKKTKDEFKGDL